MSPYGQRVGLSWFWIWRELCDLLVSVHLPFVWCPLLQGTPCHTAYRFCHVGGSPPCLASYQNTTRFMATPFWTFSGICFSSLYMAGHRYGALSPSSWSRVQGHGEMTAREPRSPFILSCSRDVQLLSSFALFCEPNTRLGYETLQLWKFQKHALIAKIKWQLYMIRRSPT